MVTAIFPAVHPRKLQSLRPRRRLDETLSGRPHPITLAAGLILQPICCLFQFPPPEANQALEGILTAVWQDALEGAALTARIFHQTVTCERCETVWMAGGRQGAGPARPSCHDSCRWTRTDLAKLASAAHQYEANGRFV